MSKTQVLNNKKLTLTLISFIVLVSLIFTILQTIYLVKNDYDDSISTVEKSIKQIKNTQIESISMAIWQLDSNQLDIIIDGILKLPGINYIEINEKGSNTIKVGKLQKEYIIEKTYHLIHKNFTNNILGTIYIQGNYKNNIDKIYNTIFERILIEMLKVFSIALILIFVVHKIIIRHLVSMAKYAVNLDTKKLSFALKLDKKIDKDNPDAIDAVANAINIMRINLINDLKQQEKDKNDLETEIENRKMLEKDALNQKDRITNQYNTIVKLTSDNSLFEKSFKDAIYFLLAECIKTIEVDRISFWTFIDDNTINCKYRYYKKEDKCLNEDKTIDLSNYKKYMYYLTKDKIIDATDVYTDERTQEYNKEDMKNIGLKSMLDVTVNFHSKIYGIICFENLEKQKEWTSDEISFATRVSDQISNLLIINEWKKSQEEIIKLNNSLEITVNERTMELKKNLENLQHTQRQLIQSEKLASLGGLVAGIAHEINTPIGISLTGSTHFQYITNQLKKLYDDNNLSKNELEEYIETSYEISNSIYISLKRAAEQIKSFKQIAVDQSNEELRKFNMKEYLEEILLSLSNQIKKTNHNISIHCDKNLIINGYPGSISQIITNFIINSFIHGFKHIKEGNINIYAKQIDNDIELIYKDDGAGINEENLKKIFDPFFTTNREGGGSGLGLNIVYNIVKSNLHGNITAVSTLNKGLIFNIKFPIKEKI